MSMEYTSFVAFVAFGSFESLHGSVLCRSQSLTFLSSIDANIHPYTNRNTYEIHDIVMIMIMIDLDDDMYICNSNSHAQTETRIQES